MSLKPFIYLLALLFFTSACQHLNISCLDINWYELGRQDSIKGPKRNISFSKRQDVCPLPPNSIYAKAYKNGFDTGLREYCNFKTGYIYSLSQMTLEASACPENLKIKFIKGYEIGSYMKEIQSLQNEIQSKIQKVNKKLEFHDNRVSMIKK